MITVASAAYLFAARTGRIGNHILLHPMYDDTGKELKVIEGVLDHLSKEGYQFVTVNELQKLNNSLK